MNPKPHGKAPCSYSCSSPLKSMDFVVSVCDRLLLSGCYLLMAQNTSSLVSIQSVTLCLRVPAFTSGSSICPSSTMFSGVFESLHVSSLGHLANNGLGTLSFPDACIPHSHKQFFTETFKRYQIAVFYIEQERHHKLELTKSCNYLFVHSKAWAFEIPLI